jgi:large subunit ribosomal protein L6
LATYTEELPVSSVTLPEGVTASLNGRELTIKRKLGEVRKSFERINVNISVEGNKILVSPFSSKRKDRVVVNTVLSILENMIKGVTKGFTYRLKIVYAHFPISVKIKGNTVLIENFIGERSPREAKIVGETKVSVEGEDVVVKGVSLEDVGQTAANIENATRIKNKDQRIFLDGIYIYSKEEGM